MLDKETIIIFPEKGIEARDGMPNFNIIFTNLKKMNEDQKVVGKRDKVANKQKADYGLPERKKDDEESKKAGSFDPKNFKNNADLYKHMTEF